MSLASSQTSAAQTDSRIIDELPLPLIAFLSDGTITRLNARAEALFHAQAKNAVGRNVREFFEGDADDALASCVRSAQAGGSDATYRTRMRGGNGRAFSALLTLSPLRDEEGRLCGGIAIVEDVNAARNEEVLDEALRYRTLFMNAGMPMLLYRADEAHVLDANRKAERAFHTTAERLRREGLRAIVPKTQPDDEPSDAAFRKAIARLAHRTEGEASFEFVFIKTDGTLFPCHVKARRFPDERTPLFRLTLTDLATLNADKEKRMIREHILIQAEKLTSLGQLSAGIAHEISQPLTGISTTVQNLLFDVLDRDIDYEEFKTELENTLEYIRRIKSIIDHIRVFSREHKDEVFEPFNIHEAITNALSLVKTQYRNHDIRLRTVFDTRIPLIEGNIYQFEQVVLNLLSNAKDAVDERGERDESEYEKVISVKTALTDTTFTVRVLDNGVGIAEENMASVLNPFFTTKPLHKGTGLGMSITYGIVRKMAGTLHIESKADQYTIITLTFPREQGVADGSH